MSGVRACVCLHPLRHKLHGWLLASALKRCAVCLGRPSLYRTCCRVWVAASLGSACTDGAQVCASWPSHALVIRRAGVQRAFPGAEQSKGAKGREQPSMGEMPMGGVAWAFRTPRAAHRWRHLGRIRDSRRRQQLAGRGLKRRRTATWVETMNTSIRERRVSLRPLLVFGKARDRRHPMGRGTLPLAAWCACVDDYDLSPRQRTGTRDRRRVVLVARPVGFREVSRLELDAGRGCRSDSRHSCLSRG